jgi:hypothetical protein
MKSININDIEIEIDDGIEVVVETDGKIVIRTKSQPQWYYYPIYPSYPVISYGPSVTSTLNG